MAITGVRIVPNPNPEKKEMSEARNVEIAINKYSSIIYRSLGLLSFIFISERMEKLNNLSFGFRFFESREIFDEICKAISSVIGKGDPIGIPVELSKAKTEL